jgi:carboxyl-terminal processing protease
MKALPVGLVFICLAVPPADAFADDDADNFTRSVCDALEIIQKNSVARPSARQLVELALRGLYREQCQQLPDDLERRVNDDKATDAQLRTLLRDGYCRLAARRELKVRAAADGAITIALRELDPHGSWVEAKNDCHFLPSAGVGAELRLDEKTGMPVVFTPIKDGPAYRAGVRAGDIISHVTQLREIAAKDSFVTEPRPTTGVDLERIRWWLLGDPDTGVILTIRREDVKEPLQVQVTRGGSHAETVHGWRRKADDSWDHVLDRERKIGYVRITVFDARTNKAFQQALDELQDRGTRGLVIDLRFCPGGLLPGAADAAGSFLDRGDLVITIQDVSGKTHDLRNGNAKPRRGMAVVCLIDGETSSAAEMFAAALVDHGRAAVVGERSWGKASLQNIERIDEREMCLTAAVFLRPGGKKLDRIWLPGRDPDEWGVTPEPENVIKLTPKERDALKEHLDLRRIIVRADVQRKDPWFEDRQLCRAFDLLRRANP